MQSCHKNGAGFSASWSLELEPVISQDEGEASISMARWRYCMISTNTHLRSLLRATGLGKEQNATKRHCLLGWKLRAVFVLYHNAGADRRIVEEKTLQEVHIMTDSRNRQFCYSYEKITDQVWFKAIKILFENDKWKGRWGPHAKLIQQATWKRGFEWRKRIDVLGNRSWQRESRKS